MISISINACFHNFMLKRYMYTCMFHAPDNPTKLKKKNIIEKVLLRTQKHLYRDIVLASSVCPSVCPHFLSVRNHISVPIGQI